MPVEVLGFNGTPEASDRLAAVATEARAREIADYRARQRRDITAARQTGMRGSLEQMMNQLRLPAARNFRWSSRATFKARSKPFSARWKSSRPMR